ncbi:GH32 C-terminal domain-containing protein [Corynebacterium pyruviciproducens]|uniref:GH32 C-terminal domain-containing protein n=1 Tax=Corynebacterium pyruviciproducens TaxID=598660 RepID=UPI002550C8BF|nr:GH32 C-terminal domain-containing protein [Corynebacterium pyruviciproducens]MDK6565566.1 GH32 C-terminal domain-containing protein [Corynebacterium pyruviciproducens]
MLLDVHRNAFCHRRLRFAGRHGLPAPRHPETPWSTGYRAAPVEGDTVHLRIVRDVSSIEVFINDCSSTISSFVFSPEENADTVVTARAIGADAELTDVYWWVLESNWN